jgi:hypothetical protein
VQSRTPESFAIAKTVALLRQLNQLTERTATVCQALFDDTRAVQARVTSLTGRIKAAESAVEDLEQKRAAGVEPQKELEYGGAPLFGGASCVCNGRIANMLFCSALAPTPCPQWPCNLL